MPLTVIVHSSTVYFYSTTTTRRSPIQLQHQPTYSKSSSSSMPPTRWSWNSTSTWCVTCDRFNASWNIRPSVSQWVLRIWWVNLPTSIGILALWRAKLLNCQITITCHWVRDWGRSKFWPKPWIVLLTNLRSFDYPHWIGHNWAFGLQAE